MIIMINGAHGVGKTTVAKQLINEIENCMIFDPEEIGFMLRNILPEEKESVLSETEDFRDLPMWKDLTIKVASLLVKNYNVNLIIPMTIENPRYFNYIFDGLKDIDNDIYHFCLIAEEDTIYSRLRERGELLGTWCFHQTAKCVKAFKDNNFSEYINTENTEVSTIARNIKEKLSHRVEMRVSSLLH